VATVKPGVQKPHCCASLLTNAACTGCACEPPPRPSAVTICLPCASIASVVHEYTARLSINTVQAHHSARSPPPLPPEMSRSPPSPSRRATRGSRLSVYFFPFTVRVTGTAPGPCIATSSPATSITVGPATSWTEAATPEIFKKSRREKWDCVSSFLSLMGILTRKHLDT